jgi:hypothetical protein
VIDGRWPGLLQIADCTLKIKRIVDWPLPIGIDRRTPRANRQSTLVNPFNRQSAVFSLQC